MELDALIAAYRACRICRDAPTHGPALPHEPRPIIQAHASARLCIAGQAPGTRVHASGRPFTDPSGDRLRAWLGVTEAVFYDARQVAILPMGGCFPGLDARGSDLPPRRECAPTWRARLMAALPRMELVVLLGAHAQRWHLGPHWRGSLTATVADWRGIAALPDGPRLFALPHPSWRNTGWLKRHGFVETELLPVLRAHVARVLA